MEKKNGGKPIIVITNELLAYDKIAGIWQSINLFGNWVKQNYK